ncbi:response regulator transcription factor [Thioclava sp. GXIMD4216]|uniref:response regulator transcription factor n=1 Tax=Thioclava sp. GXIMD4216 TaxID=3131929 RepID=UPI0030D19726
MTHVFLLEDDADIRQTIQRSLQADGFEVQCFSHRAEFLRAMKSGAPDLCLIDLGLPDGDGLSLLGSASLPRSVPRIVVSGRGGAEDRILGLEIGADDYIVKPFEPRELTARIHAVLRRSDQQRAARPDTQRPVVRFGAWTADFDACALCHEDGEVLQLSSAEADLLQVFVRSAGRVLTRNQLLDAAATRGDDPFDRAMDARVSRLRRKLRDDPRAPQIIRTVYGAGYVFVPKVS